MELWIRSQDKVFLRKVNTIGIVEGRDFWGIEDNFRVSFGKYKTKERALEVLDEIQSLLQPTIEYKPIEYKPIVQEEYNPAYGYKHFVKVDDNMEIKELSIFVYQMPEK